MTNTRTDSYEETIQVNAPTIISAELSNVHIIKVSPSNHGEIIVTNKEAFSGEIITAAIKAHLGYQIQNLKIVTPIKTIMIIKDGVLFENADPSVTVQRNEKYLQKLFFKLNLHSDVKIEADFVYQKLNILVGVYLYLNRTEKFLQGSVLQASISQQINFLYNVDPKIVSLINIQGKKYSDPNEIAKICSGFSFKVKNTHSITIRVTDPTKIVPELSLGEINFDEEEDSAKISTNYNDKDELYREILVLN